MADERYIEEDPELDQGSEATEEGCMSTLRS